MTLSTTCCLLMTLDVFIYSFVHFWIFIIIRFSFHNYNVFSQNRQRTFQFIHAQAHTKMSFGCHETNILTLMSSKITYDKRIKFCISCSVIMRNVYNNEIYITTTVNFTYYMLTKCNNFYELIGLSSTSHTNFCILYLAAMIWSENVSFLALAYFTQEYKQDSRYCTHTCVIITMTARTKIPRY